MTAQTLTTRQAARALGVSEASLKRWCDQGLLPAVRTPGGHRRLPLSGLVQFVRARRLQLVRPGLLGLGSFADGPKGEARSSVAALQSALETGDENAIRDQILGAYLAGTSAVEILDDVITPAFRAIGERWAHGALSIYEERRAVELCSRELQRLRMLLPLPASDAPCAIGGTLAGDPYSLPTTMIEIALCEAGWRAQSYGCGLPASTLVEAVRDVHPQMLWLSVSTFDSAEKFLADYAVLYAAARECGIPVLVGGRMLTSDVRGRMEYSAYGDNLRHAVAFAHALYPSASRKTVGGERR